MLLTGLCGCGSWSNWLFGRSGDYDHDCPLLKKSSMNTDMGGEKDSADGEAKTNDVGAGHITRIYDLSKEPISDQGGDATYIFYPASMVCGEATFYVLAQIKGQPDPCFVHYRRFRKAVEERDGDDVETIWRWEYERDIVGCGIKSNKDGRIDRHSARFIDMQERIDAREAARLRDFEALVTDDHYLFLKKMFPFPLSDYLPDSRRTVDEVESWLNSAAYLRIDSMDELAYGDILIERSSHNRLAIYLGRGFVATLRGKTPAYERLAKNYSGAYRLVPAYGLMGYTLSATQMSRISKLAAP